MRPRCLYTTVAVLAIALLTAVGAQPPDDAGTVKANPKQDTAKKPTETKADKGASTSAKDKAAMDALKAQLCSVHGDWLGVGTWKRYKAAAKPTRELLEMEGPGNINAAAKKPDPAVATGAKYDSYTVHCFENATTKKKETKCAGHAKGKRGVVDCSTDKALAAVVASHKEKMLEELLAKFGKKAGTTAGKPAPAAGKGPATPADKAKEKAPTAAA